MERRHRIEKCLGGGSRHDDCCPYCYENRKQRANHKGHRYYVSVRTPTHYFWEDIMQRPSQAARPKKGEFNCPDEDFKLTYPRLAAGLCDCWWDDGKPREPWSVKFQMKDDAVVFTITDKDSKLVAFTTAEGFVEGLAAIEKALEGGGLSWRKSRY